MKFLQKILMAEVEKEEGEFNSYLEKLEAGDFKDKMFYGVAEDKRGFLYVDPVQQPGALYCGGMGSGKSIAMRTTLLTHMAANSENTVYILVDVLKGMTDYAIMFPYTDNVATALNDQAKLIPTIEMIYQECMARKEEFSRVNANNIYQYEKIMKKQDPNFQGLARIILAIEEFHAIPNAEVIKYHMNVDRNGSPAAMLKDLLRVGRSYGIQLLAATQRATSDDFPSSLKPGITQLMAFRVNNPGDATAINLSLAADIRSDQRGRCVYEGGFIQFPYIDDDSGIELLKKYYKPLKAKMLRYKMADYHQAFSGEGNQGMVKVKTLKSLLENHTSFKSEDIVTRVLEYFDFKVKPQINDAINVNLIAERDGVNYGVLILKGRGGNSGSKKAVEAFKQALGLIGCTSMIAISLDGNIPSDVLSAKNSLDGYEADQEDLQRIASVFDNLDLLKREGKFEQMLEKLSLVRRSLDKKESPPDKDKKNSDIDDLFAEFATIGKEKKNEVKTELPKVEIKPIESKKEEILVKPEVSTGGGKDLLDLRERLKASLKSKAKNIEQQA